ncbi:MAG: hypothetical protein HQM14_05645 [SAR324 cluster bacterium]|nr:hypothetical protein [SAR324 cluster bacterium]
MNEQENVEITLKQQNEKEQQLIIQLLQSVWEDDGDIQTFIQNLMNTEIQGKTHEELISDFEQNAQQLADDLNQNQKFGAVFFLKQLTPFDPSSRFGPEKLKALAQCMLFITHLADEDDVRHFFDRFQLVIDATADEDSKIKLGHGIMQHLAELMIILGVTNGLGEEDIDFIFKVTRKEWEGSGKEVGPFLNNIFKEVEVRESIGQDLIARFKEVCETMNQLCDDKQRKKVVGIIQGLIDADEKVTVQEKILYNIIKETMVV